MRLKKITVEVPEDLLQRAQAEGEGVSDTVREALALRAHQRACRELLRWRGKIRWSIDWETMRDKS
jgi:post-segregation antitoxin (ccd killing protein)